MTPSIRSTRVRRVVLTFVASLGAVLTLGACATSRPAEDDTGAAGDRAPMPGATPGATTDTTTMPTSSGVSIELDRMQYAAGDMVTLRIVNRSGAGLGYNACTRIVERRDGGSWVAVPEPERVCTMELRLLGAGETATERTDLPRSLTTGDYRLALRLSREEQPAPGPGTPAAGPIRATSALFRVQ